MDEQTVKTKEELYVELKQLLSYKRFLVGRGSLLRFMDIYLSNMCIAATPPFHKEMLSMLYDSIWKDIREKDGTRVNKEEKVALERILFMAPRGFAKSTLCSVAFPLFLACYGVKKDIFLVSATMSLAKELLRKIRNEIEGNEKLKEDFGELKSDKWTEDMLVLANGVTLRAKGRGFQIRGFRPDMIVCDDLEDEEVIYSKEQRDKMEVWFFRTLLPALKPGQNLVYVGTKLHQFSLISKLEIKEEFVVKGYKALVNDESIWPELWSTQRLKNLKRELGTYAFEAEYQNNPISLHDQPVKPEMIDGVKVGGKREVRCLAIDPAISEKEGADYRAFVMFDRTEKGFKEVYSERGRWGIDEQVDRIIELYERFKPDRIVIEEVAFQKVFRTLLLERSRKRKIFLPVTAAELGKAPGKKPRDKFTRLLGVVHLFEQKLVEVSNPDMIEELLSFPHGDHDDMVDACVYALAWLMGKSGGRTMNKDEIKGVPVTTSQSFAVTEVRPGVFMVKVDGIMPPPKIRSNFINCEKR